MLDRRQPGNVRDAVIEAVDLLGEARLVDIQRIVESRIGVVPPSSVRSCLNLHIGHDFERAGRGVYRSIGLKKTDPAALATDPIRVGKAALYQDDCFEWLARQPPRSIHAVVTDPPYSPLEYSEHEHAKLRSGRGGVWRIPPSFDGHQRAPLPRFTVLSDEDRIGMRLFFTDLARQLARVCVPGANVIVASNPLLAHVVASALVDGGLEMRGYISRLVQTMRGGDRPKNAHLEFDGVSVMPRSQHEPWIVCRVPLEGRVQDNLRRWNTGGFRRLGPDKPFGDVIRSTPTPAAERKIAAHPSLKPQALLRHLVRASLPLGEGIVLDPFAGSGSTLAAANAVGYASVGVERDAEYLTMAKAAIAALAKVSVSYDL
jgi:DNA modification methylase